MANSKTLWECVLCEKTRKQLNLIHGVTVPFMVGVYYEKGYLRDDELEDSNCIKKIFDLIVDNLNEDFLLIEDCVQNEEGRGTYLDKITTNEIIHILQWPRRDDTIDNRQDYRGHIFFPKKWNFKSDLILQLWEFYGSHIKKHEFSWNSTQSKWNVFSPSVNGVDELSIIRNL